MGYALFTNYFALFTLCRAKDFTEAGASKHYSRFINSSASVTHPVPQKSDVVPQKPY
jgi:hypothetical protein